jgi:hypothetical protein
MKFALIDIFNDVLVGIVLFGSAGRLNWPRAWVLLSVRKSVFDYRPPQV